MSKDIDQLPPTTPEGSQPDANGAGVSKEGTTGGGKSDAGNSVDLSKYVPVEQLNKLRSTMDRQVAEQQKQFQQVQEQYKSLLEKYEKNEMEGLTDEELVAYQAEKAQYEASRKTAEAQQKVAQLEYERNFIALQRYYLSKGAPKEIIEIDDPAAMQEAYLNWLIEGKSKAEAQLAKLQQGVTNDKNAKPPTVTTHKPAAGSLGKVSWSNIKPGSKEEQELFNAVESGKLKPEDIEN